MALFAYDNLLRAATIDSEVSENSFSYSVDGAGFSFAGVLADGYAVFDLDSAKAIDTICLQGHNFATVGASIKIEVSSDNSTYIDKGTFTPLSNGVVLYSITSTTYRYVKITILNHTGTAYINNLFVGEALQLPGGMQKGFVPPDQCDSDTVKANLTANGLLVGLDVTENPIVCKIPLINFDRSWFKSNWLGFVESVKLYPAYFLWEAGAQPIYFKFNKKPPVPKFTTHLHESVTISIEGVI